MEKVFLNFFAQPLVNFLYENVTRKDLKKIYIHIWTKDQYSRPTSIKNGQLADAGNPKYTLRHGLGWGFIWVLPQGHVKVISRSNQPRRGKMFLLFLLQLYQFKMSMMIETHLGPNTEVHQTHLKEVTGVI